MRGGGTRMSILVLPDPVCVMVELSAVILVASAVWCRPKIELFSPTGITNRSKKLNLYQFGRGKEP